MVIGTTPEPFGTLTELDRAVEFRFDERISERVSSGALATAVTVSPRTGEVRVDKGARSLRVRPRDGFQPGQVYRITLKAVVSDMFGNRMTDPFELVFTTGGPEPVATTLAGEVWDRVSGRAVTDASVLAVGPDGIVHQATSDVGGIYAFRYLPGGVFSVTAFEDRNRDGEVDSMEVQGSTTVDIAAGDTLLVDVAMLEPDTLAARVADAEILDSVTVVVTFDDYLDPDVDASTYDVVVRAPDAEPLPVLRVYQEAEYAAYVREVTDSLARRDSIQAAAATRAAAEAAARRADSAAADSAAGVVPPDSTAPPDTSGAMPPAITPPPDTVRVGAPSPRAQVPVRAGPVELSAPQGSRPGPTADGRRVLPGQRIVVVLGETLDFDVPYEVVVSGVRNIAGLEGGGGSAELLRERPIPPDTASVDTATVDTSATGGGAPPDTGALARRPSRDSRE